MNYEELKENIGSMNREQKLEVLAKMGIKLRAALSDDQKRFPKIRLDAYFCPTNLLEEYDKMLTLLKE